MLGPTHSNVQILIRNQISFDIILTTETLYGKLSSILLLNQVHWKPI